MLFDGYYFANFVYADGVAPRAKMNQQRSRRFRSAQEAKEKEEDKEEFLKMLKSQNGGTHPVDNDSTVQKKVWDTNAITPGTPFMHLLAESLRYWCAYKVNTDPAWEKVYRYHKPTLHSLLKHVAGQSYNLGCFCGWRRRA